MTESLLPAHWNTAAIWLISLSSIARILIRPKRLPEAWWAVAGAFHRWWISAPGRVMTGRSGTPCAPQVFSNSALCS